MSSDEPNRMTREFVGLLARNIELANAIGEHLNLPADEALRAFQRDLIARLDTEAAYNRTIDELNYVNEAAARNKQLFTERLQRYQANISQCNAQNQTYLRELQALRLSLQSDIETRVAQTNAIGQQSQQQRQQQRAENAETRKLKKTITEQLTAISQLTHTLQSLQTNNNYLSINSTVATAQVAKLEAELIRRQEQLEIANAQLSDARERLKSVEESARVGVSLILDEDVASADREEIQRLRREIDELRKDPRSEYTELINNFITSNPDVRSQVILDEEIKRRDERIKKLETALKSIPPTALDERLRAMSSMRRERLYGVLVKYHKKIHPYDRAFSSKIEDFMRALDVDFDETFDYIDTLLTILTEINIISIEKLYKNYDEATLNDIQEKMRQIERTMNDGVGLDDQLQGKVRDFIRSVDTIITSLRETEESTVLDRDLLDNRRLHDENLRHNYEAMVRELTICRNATSDEQTRIIRQQLQSLTDMSTIESTEDDPSDPINYNILLNRLKLEKSSRGRLRRAFKELTESKESELDDLRSELLRVETELTRVNAANESLKRQVTDDQTRHSLDTEYLTDMLKYIKLILERYTSMCKGPTSRELTEKIRKLAVVGVDDGSTELLHDVVDRLKSIAEIAIPCILGAANASSSSSEGVSPISTETLSSSSSSSS